MEKQVLGRNLESLYRKENGSDCEHLQFTLDSCYLGIDQR